MTSQGEFSKSIVIQEVAYSDAASYANILAGRNATGLNIRTIMQWPVIAGDDQNFSVDYCPEYRSYNPFPPTGLKGTVIANPAVSTIPTTGANGLSTISWNTNSSSSGKVKLANGVLFASGISGSKDAPWISTTGNTFNLWIGSVISDSNAAYAVTEKGKLATSSSSNTCTLAPGSSTCTQTIYWSVPDTTETIQVKLANGTLFAQGGETGQKDATFITTSGNTFNLYAGSKLLDSVTVYAVP